MDNIKIKLTKCEGRQIMIGGKPRTQGDTFNCTEGEFGFINRLAKSKKGKIQFEQVKKVKHNDNKNENLDDKKSSK